MMRVVCIGPYRATYDKEFKGLGANDIQLEDVIKQIVETHPDSYEEYLKQYDLSYISLPEKFLNKTNEECLELLESTQRLFQMADHYNFCRGREKYEAMMKHYDL